MPEVCRFFGIVIQFYYNDHEPPHFHAVYGRSRVVVGIVDLALLQGSLPPRALGLVMEWAALHREELLEDWRLARSLAPLKKIPPLE